MREDRIDVLIVGGGGSGMVAAGFLGEFDYINTAIAEKNDRVGKKILATGNGQCNLTNTDLDLSHFRGDEKLISSVFAAAPQKRTLAFLKKCGVFVSADERGRIYPLSRQASSVLDALRAQYLSRGVREIVNAEVTAILPRRGGFTVCTRSGEICARKVLFCPGGKSGAAFGTDGSAYGLLTALGHGVTPLSPSLCAFTAKKGEFFNLKGIRVEAEVSCPARESDGGQSVSRNGNAAFWENRQSALAGNKKETLSANKDALSAAGRDFCCFKGDGRVSVPKTGTRFAKSGAPYDKKEVCRGDVLFNENGVSGDAVFRLSARAPEPPFLLTVSFLPDVDEQEVREMLSFRAKISGITAGDVFTTVLHKQIGRNILKRMGISPAESADRVDLSRAAKLVKAFPIEITGTAGFAASQVTRGGIPASEIDPETLESLPVPGLYFAGEVLDVDGDCGGYNLQWAMSSALCAAESIVNALRAR